MEGHDLRVGGSQARACGGVGLCDVDNLIGLWGHHLSSRSGHINRIIMGQPIVFFSIPSPHTIVRQTVQISTMLKSTVLPLFMALATFTSTSAHPGESEEHHLAEARALKGSHHYIKRSGAAYSGCSNSARKRSLNNIVAERRAAEIAELRAGVKAKKSEMAKRQAPSGVSMSGSAVMPSGTMSAGGGGPDGNSTGGAGGGGGSATFDTYGKTLLNTSHASTRTDLTSNSTSYDLFDSTSSYSGNDTACLLQPEVTIGPYWVAGEFVREDMSENQSGIPIYMSTQVIDVATCEPVVGLYWEMWHANASGVYSGVVATGNGDSSDASNINATFCRGIQPTDDQGVARILSVAPGHVSDAHVSQNRRKLIIPYSIPDERLTHTLLDTPTSQSMRMGPSGLDLRVMAIPSHFTSVNSSSIKLY